MKKRNFIPLVIVITLLLVVFLFLAAREETFLSPALKVIKKVSNLGASEGKVFQYCNSDIDCESNQKCVQNSCRNKLCADSDGGKEAEIFGQVTISIEGFPSGGSAYIDECAGNSQLKEFRCDGVNPASELVDCYDGCRNGACIPDKIFMTFSTEKDKYDVGEQVLLTASDTAEMRGYAETDLTYVNPAVRDNNAKMGEATTGDATREVIAPVTQEEITTRTQGLAQVKQNIASGSLRWKAGLTSNIYKSKAEIEKEISPAPEELPAEQQDLEWNTDCIRCDEDSDCPTDSYCVYETIRHPVGCCSEKMPDYFDWRNRHGKNYVTDVKLKDQECSQAEVWGVLGTMDAKINAYYNNPNIDKDFSVMDVIACGEVGVCDDSVFNWPSASLYYIQGAKVALEQDLPSSFMSYYEMPECEDKSPDWMTRAWGITSWENVCDGVCDYIQQIENPITIQHIKKTIMEKGPVIVGFLVTDDLYLYYEEGIYEPSQAQQIKGAHMATIVGWGKSDGIDYWIVKNTWSNDWGEDGYFRIKMRDGETHIDTWLVHAIDAPIPPTPQQEICIDADSDGYCAWGLGNWGGKPTTGCPACSDVQDCDDSKPEVYENCDILSGEKAPINVRAYLNGEPYLGEADIYINDYFVKRYNFMGTTYGDWVSLSNLDVGDRYFKATAISEDGETEYVGFAYAEVGHHNEIVVEMTEAPKIVSPIPFEMVEDPYYGWYFTFHLYNIGQPLPVTWTYQEPVENFKVEWGYGGKQIDEDGPYFADIYSEEGVSYNELGSATIDTSVFKRAGVYTLRLTTHYPGDGVGNGVEKKILVFVDNLKEGWPQDSLGRYNRILTADVNDDMDKEILAKDATGITVYNYRGEIINRLEMDGCISNSGLSLIVGDIDGDGQSEVITDGNSQYGCSYILYAWESDGSPVAGFPLTHTQLNMVGTGSHNLHLMDINNDGAMEILIEYGNTLNAISGSGEIFSEEGYNWPIPLTNPESNIAIGDVDGDGNGEIVMRSLKNGQKALAVYSVNGEIETLSVDCPIETGFELGDVDGDGDLEVFSELPKLYICHHTGEIISQNIDFNYLDVESVLGYVDSQTVGMALANHHNWDYQLHLFGEEGQTFWVSPWLKYGGIDYYTEPVMADVNGDGRGEIFVPNYDSYGDPPYEHPFQSRGIWGFNSDGTYTEGFKMTDGHEGQKVLYAPNNANLVIDDLDRDGKFELIATDETGIVYVWEIPGYYRTPVYGWPTYMQNLAQTGSLEDKMKLAPKSQIRNEKKIDVNGIINMKVQRKLGNGWTDVETVISNAELFVPMNNKASLSDLWNNPWTAQEPGRYRIHGEFRFNQRLLDYDYEFDVIASQSECGDGEVDYGEFCDGESRECINVQGYNGVQNCRPDCSAFSECILQESCGDSIINGDEICDGSDLAGKSCTDFGWVSPEGLACKSDCTDFDISGCAPAGEENCGNNVKEPEEKCDGTDLNGQTCESVGWSGGTLGCYPLEHERACTFDASQCTGCGNNIENPDGTCTQTILTLTNDGYSTNTASSYEQLPSFIDVATGAIGSKGKQLAFQPIMLFSYSYDNWNDQKVATVYRGYLPFDTSVMPEGAYAQSAEVSLTTEGSIMVYPSNMVHPWFVITDVNPADVLNPESTDLYMSYGNVEGSNRVNLANLQDNTPAVFTLNSEAINWINVGGYTTLGMRMGPDLMLETGGFDALFNLHVRFTSAGGAEQERPKLDVTYSRTQM